jgi:hypothetical protein
MFSEAIKSLGHISMDVVVLAGLFILFLAYGIYFGRDKIISALLSFYPAEFLFEHFPFLSKLIFLHGDLYILLNKVLIFLVFFVPINIIVARFVFSDSGYGSVKVLRIAGLSLAAVVSILLFTYSVLNLDLAYNFGGAIDSLFSSPERIFYWRLVPLGILFLL